MKWNKRSAQHIIFWLISLLLLAWFYTQLTKEYKHTLVLVAIVLPVSILSVYFINFKLIPRYYFREKYLQFSVFTVFTIIAAVWLTLLVVFIYFSILVTKTGGKNFPFFIDVAFILAGLFLLITAGVLAHVMRENFRTLKVKASLENEKLEMKAKLKEIELDYLKAQFHPHFLFNTLNNLYSLSLKKSDDAPEMILKLSRLLDYSLYSSGKKSVSIAEEIDFVQNYLDIILMRFGSGIDLLFQKKISNPDFSLAPLILIPFIENATKHGIGPGPDNRIEIRVEQKNEDFLFSVKNNKPVSFPASVKDHEEKSGIGLNQIKNRLQLLYPGKHLLEIDESKDIYEIRLSLYA